MGGSHKLRCHIDIPGLFGFEIMQQQRPQSKHAGFIAVHLGKFLENYR